MAERFTASSITDDALDDLYARLEAAEAAVKALGAAVTASGRPVGPEARPMAARPSDRACVSDLGAA